MFCEIPVFSVPDMAGDCAATNVTLKMRNIDENPVTDAMSAAFFFKCVNILYSAFISTICSHIFWKKN